MAEHIRAHDWASTLLGPVESGSWCLKVTVDLVQSFCGPTLGR